MLLPKFDFHEPATIKEACRVVTDLGQEAKLLAGGTDLLVNMKKKTISPKHLISLSRIGELKKIDSSNGSLKIGACCTASELGDSEVIRKDFVALSNSALSLGSPLIRNLATIAGNIVTARPAADLPPPLMVYGAKILLKKSSGERLVPIEEFFKWPGETVIETDEILTEFVIEKPPSHSGAAFIKLGVREALEISLISVAASISLDQPGGVINEACIAMGSVAPTTIRAYSAEKILKGEKPSEALFAKAGDVAAGDSRPIDDFRASAAYKRAMAEVLTRRALQEALDRATGD